MFGFFKRKKEETPPQPTPEPAKRRYTRIARRSMDGARMDRLTADWISSPLTADQIIQTKQRVLVARSRDQALNNDYAKAFVRMAAQNIVGSKGIVLQAQSKDQNGQLDTLANEAIEAAFADWSKREHCDVSGRQSFRAIQASCVSSAAINGEFMVRKIFGREAGDYSFALQILDPQRCNPDYNRFDLADGNYIRAGIEFNKYGRPVAFHFTVGSEADAYYDYAYAGSSFMRIPADEIIHGFVPEMVGQKRGLPWFSAGLYRLKNLAGFEDAAIVNARVGASKMGVIQWRDGHGPDLSDDELADFEMTAEPGEFPVMPEGAELKEWAPTFPSGEFATFSKAMLRGISAGLGVLYNNLASDLEGVNYSSIRQGTLDEREHWKDLQEWLVESLMQPVFDSWIKRALLLGRITVKGRPLKPERIDRYSVVAWQPRRWAWIDPQADVQASISAKNALLQSPGQIIRDQGKDPATVWREVARDIAEMRAAGIPEAFIQSAIFDKNLQAAVMAQTAEKLGETGGK